MRPPALDLNQIRELLPVYRLTIPKDYEDYNGHMNIRWYVVIFDDAGLPLYDEIGLSPDMLLNQGNSTFDLEHHIHYLNEVQSGDEITVYVRMVARSAKRMHYLMFMVNESRQSLASIFECVNTFVDLNVRRSTAYPADVATAIDVLLASHQQLAWDAPICGTMQA